MKFAVVEIAGKQFLAQKGEIIETPKIPGAPGERVTFSSVLMYWDGKNISIGKPCLEGFSVEARIQEFDRGPKIVAYKFKRRKDSHRKVGHRQSFARVEIERISIPGEPPDDSPDEPAEASSVAEPEAAGQKQPAVRKPAGAKKPGVGKQAKPAEESAE